MSQSSQVSNSSQGSVVSALGAAGAHNQVCPASKSMLIASATGPGPASDALAEAHARLEKPIFAPLPIPTVKRKTPDIKPKNCFAPLRLPSVKHETPPLQNTPTRVGGEATNLASSSPLPSFHLSDYENWPPSLVLLHLD
ncbi:uncharacterized protein MELLADRAFT_112817 [Melampsora larici-populina 98AG31]|uniref:Uncharacterized protein n=1 Tax=Melampsora larici-populina (strain 98AG31 / pathotype 3-4-7) TaxID=747676 RepID=F4S7S5_MELLP|nr:uncharacterized protein MELLADRAFT_112817 [Melampsora larici-populina 98AG31]EGF99309.1 hypothetical protein MELLADRAFT_112817 [Melampsora larici-populina 98AG31]